MSLNQDDYLELIDAAVERGDRDRVRELTKRMADTAPAKPADEEVRPPAPTLSIDEVKAMGADEINARWDEIQPVLAQES